MPKQSVITHLEELRKRLIIILVSIFFLFILCFLFNNLIIDFLRSNLLKNINIIVITPFEIILTKINLSLYMALFLSIPIILYQVVLFVKPALNKKEKRILYYGIFLFFILFLLGLSFAYLVLLKIGIAYLAKIAITAGIQNFWSFRYVVSFIFFSGLALGLVFEMPLILYLLNKLNLISIQRIKKARSYIYIGAFILAALITAPDPLTQLLIAIPLLILFEVSVVVVKLI